MPIAHGANDAKKLIALISGKGQHRALKAFTQYLRLIGVGRPANTRV